MQQVANDAVDSLQITLSLAGRLQVHTSFDAVFLHQSRCEDNNFVSHQLPYNDIFLVQKYPCCHKALIEFHCILLTMIASLRPKCTYYIACWGKKSVIYQRRKRYTTCWQSQSATSTPLTLQVWHSIMSSMMKKFRNQGRRVADLSLQQPLWWQTQDAASHRQNVFPQGVSVRLAPTLLNLLHALPNLGNSIR